MSDFLTLDEVRSAPPPLWLVHQIIVQHSFPILYGYRGLGKTFVALDLAYRVASGVNWFGRRVRIGEVIYVMAGEGTYGLGSRTRAWEMYNCELDEGFIRWQTTPVILTEKKEVNGFIKSIRRQHVDPTLIVFDTLARCAPGIVENSNEGMGAVVAGVDEIRGETGACVLLVHHSGKPDDEGRTTLRGHSSLESAADTIVHLDQDDDGLKLVCEKQKEAPHFPTIRFKLKSIAVGDEEESCVPVRESVSIRPHKAASEAKPKERRVASLMRRGRG